MNEPVLHDRSQFRAGHNSLLVYVEGQIHYAVSGITTILRNNLRYLDVREDVQRRYDRRIQQRLTKTTWMSGCSSWYLTKDGFNASMYPGFATQYLRQMRDFRFDDDVAQLFDAAVQPHGVAASGEYRIEELARLAGTTTRNIRVYRDRGLLHPPLRVGRIVLFNDTHLTRLRLITSLLDRGYNISHVHEMLSAWEQGKDVGDMLGLESAIAGSWATEKPERMSIADAKRLVDDDPGFDRMVGLGVIKLEDGEAVVVRPKLIEAFNDIRQYGVATDKLLDVHEQVAPLIDQISGILVQAGIEQVVDRIKPGAKLPPDTEVAELITMLVRLRTKAVSAVSATLAFSIESTIESAVGQILGDLIEKEAGTETPPEA